MSVQSDLDQLQATLTSLRAQLVPMGTTIHVPAGGDLQAALTAAQPGDTIVLANGLYTGNFLLPAKTGTGFITLIGANSLPLRRITPSDASLLPKLQAPAGGAACLRTEPGAHHYALVGLEVLGNPGGYGDLVQLGDGSSAQRTLASVPHDLLVDRCYLHGDPLVGQKRGIALNSASTTIHQCFISDCKVVGQDSQAIMGWNGPGPFTITDCYLEAAGENLLFGGADPSIPNLVPADILVSGCALWKPLGWRQKTWQVKNLLELKNARRVSITGNDLQYCWGQAQVGYAVLFTPRNQDGSAPWSTVEDVVFEQNTVQHSAAVVQLLDTDNDHPSGVLSRITIRNNTFRDIDPVTFTGSDKAYEVEGGVIDVTFEGNVLTGQGLGSVLYFTGLPKAQRLIFTNNTYPTSLYGIFGAGSSVGGTPVPHAFTDFVDNGTFSGNTETP